MHARALTIVGLMWGAAALAACGDDGTSTKPVRTAPAGVFPPTAGARVTAQPTPPPAASAPAGTPVAAATQSGTAANPDGTYAFDLSVAGFTAELLLAVRNGALVISQMNVLNGTGAAINAVPRLRYFDAQRRSFDALTEGDWRLLYPEDSIGLADGQRAQIRVGFTQPFDPTSVTFCMNLGTQDLGCFTRRPVR